MAVGDWEGRNRGLTRTTMQDLFLWWAMGEAYKVKRWGTS